jgi:hypothetical protein
MVLSQSILKITPRKMKRFSPDSELFNLIAAKSSADLNFKFGDRQFMLGRESGRNKAESPLYPRVLVGDSQKWRRQETSIISLSHSRRKASVLGTTIDPLTMSNTEKKKMKKASYRLANRNDSSGTKKPVVFQVAGLL